MNRPISPLLHDYKQSVLRQTKKSKALQWFMVGLGIPLIIIIFINILNKPTKNKISQDNMLEANNIKTLQTFPVDDLKLENNKIKNQILEPTPTYEEIELKISEGDTLEKLFRQYNLNIGELMLITELDKAKNQFRRIKPGDTFKVIHKDDQIISLRTKINIANDLIIERQESGFVAKIFEQPLEIKKRTAAGVITSSLFESAITAGLSDKIIMNIAEIFAWDVDFVLDIRQGDSYYVQFEEIWQDGKHVSDGEIIAAEFNNNGRTIQAIRFINDEGYGNYFTPSGKSLRKAFIRAPVDFTRISSNFNPKRKHPILNTIRAHRGVDYAAPKGTPIKASGDGKIIFRGNKTGYGKTIIIQHGGNITTLYAHMSDYILKAKVGTKVRQGQTIGFVGSTGLATANHLHYEYRVNGVHRNPRTVNLPDAKPIEEKYRSKFLAKALPIVQDLQRFKKVQSSKIVSTNR